MQPNPSERNAWKWSRVIIFMNTSGLLLKDLTVSFLLCGRCYQKNHCIVNPLVLVKVLLSFYVSWLLVIPYRLFHLDTALVTQMWVEYQQRATHCGWIPNPRTDDNFKQNGIHMAEVSREKIQKSLSQRRRPRKSWAQLNFCKNPHDC